MSIAEVDRVIDRLGEVVAWAKAEPSRCGYFAALYRKVTVAVRDGILAGQFDDGERMARLDAVFANRYLDAFDAWRSGGQPTRSWQLSFEKTASWRPIVVQQLLAGINAHINLDLGIAAATVAPGDAIGGLRDDFNRINSLLGGLVAGVVEDVGSVSPWVKFLDRIGGRSETVLIGFSIDIARDEAWKLATTLAALPEDRWQAEIDRVDGTAAGLGRFLFKPGVFLPWGLLLIRLRESNDVARVIDVLGD